MALFFRLSITIVLLSGCAESQPRGVPVSRAEFGDRWPLTVESGSVECVDGFMAVFYHGGKSYALNGIAKRKYAEIDPIWRDNPDIPGTKINISPLIDLARKQCK